MHLNVASQQLDGVSVNRLLESTDKTIVENEHSHRHTHASRNQKRPAALPPHIAPCDAKI
jgi:hypothetical protein